MNKKVQSMAFVNLISAILFLALGIWAWFQMENLQQVKDTFAQPSAFPQIMAAGLIIFAAILLVQSVLSLIRMKPNTPATEKAPSINIVKDKGVQAAVVVILLCVLFVVLMKPLGYILTSAIVCLIIMFLIGKRKPVQMILVSVLVPLGMWLIFYKVLTVKIPLGPLTFLQDLVDKIRF